VPKLEKPAASDKRSKKSAAKGAGTTSTVGLPHAGDPVSEDSRQIELLPFPVVGVGASAGGLEAFSQLLKALPTDIGMAFVFVQHLDPTHPSMLTEILQRSSRIPVSEAVDQTKVEPDRVYVIPPGNDMIIQRGVLKISARAEGGASRTVDHFLRSLAEDQRHKAIGVVLSGAATDGTLGLLEIKGEGGITFAQDSSAAYDGMPNSAISARCVDFVLSPKRIAAELVRISRHPYVTHDIVPPAEPLPPLSNVIDIIYKTMRVDFSGYKTNTLQRRTSRRMVLHKLDDIEDYIKLLRASPAEVRALFEDVLINVTSFFRNPEAFESLKQRVFPKLVENRDHDPVRIWVLGCATGEEAYSLAIAFSEFAEANDPAVTLQIFATDLNGAGIDKARAGLYSKSITQDVSPERLRRYFTEVDGSFQVKKPIRDSCVFAVHNSLADPPFSHVDLVSCRNLLIYLDGNTQQRMIPTLHYSLEPGGFLWLGNSETIGSYREYFESVDGHHKIYAKKPRASLPVHFPLGITPMHSRMQPASPALREGLNRTTDPVREADRIVLSRFAPAGVLVNFDLDVLQFRGETGPFLAHSPGRASLNLLRMLREGLASGVREAFEEAKRKMQPSHRKGLRVRSNGHYRKLDLEVIPVPGTSKEATNFLILMVDADSGAHLEDFDPPRARHDPSGKDTSESEIDELRNEVKATRDHLQSVIEQQEAANEELQSANEEVQSANEELQSINEELETSKEEIQSSNEELSTVNDELQNRNRELGKMNNDMANLLSSVQMAIVMLGPDLRIRRFTPMAEKLLNLIPADIGRSLGVIRHTFEIPNLTGVIESVIDTALPREFEVKDSKGHWYLLRVRPYRTLEDKIDGAVLVLVDVDSLKRSNEAQLRLSELLDQTREPIFMWTVDGLITYWNAGAEYIYGYGRDEAVGRNIDELLKSSTPVDAIRRPLQEGGEWAGEIRRRTNTGDEVIVEARIALGKREEGLALETNHPITERKRLEETLRRRAEALASADRAKNEFLAMLAHELRNPLAAMRAASDVLARSKTVPPILNRTREIMDRQMHNMTRMVDDLLDVARLERGKIELAREPIQLGPLLEGVMQSAHERVDLEQRKLELHLPKETMPVYADTMRVEQILGNLLNNAVKFTGAKGRIEVRAETKGKGDGSPEVLVRVRDDGLGIEPELLGTVFGLFFQADVGSGRRSGGGLGVGLTLSQRLAELHGGHIEAKSEGRGKGSEFVVHLPLADGMEAMVVEPEPGSKGWRAQPARVLIVDDNRDLADSMALLLSAEGHEVQVTYDGRSTLDRVREFVPRVALIDVSLPDMDGIEVARRLRQNERLRDTRIIAVSGYSDHDLARWHGDNHFDGHLTKPVDVQQLLEVVNGQEARKGRDGDGSGEAG
jgi:two-component system CheB/CheR fusion protein